MPARRRNYPLRNIKKIKVPWKLLIVIGILFFSALFYKYIIFRQYWTGKDKLNLVVREKTGNVSVLILDPESREITQIIIPGTTQVNVAHELGVWKISSVWDLGKNEGLTGRLMASTVTKFFKFPVYLWADEKALGFAHSSPFGIIRAALSPYKTNLTAGDKLAIGLFAFKVKNVDRTQLDLSKTTFLKKKVLEDGTEGFIVSGFDSPKLYAGFDDKDFSGKTLKVAIRDGAGDNESAATVDKVIETLGAQVTSITKETGSLDFSCQVDAKNKKVAAKVSELFGCSKVAGPSKDEFDLTIILGNKFVHNF